MNTFGLYILLFSIILKVGALSGGGFANKKSGGEGNRVKGVQARIALTPKVG